MAERWRQITGYEGFYEVSDAGRVRSLARVVRIRAGTRCRECLIALSGKVLKPNIDRKRQYPHVTLSREGKTSRRSIHLLVAAEFLPEKPTPSHEINHKNGNKRDPAAGNLEWLTRSENAKHAFALGLRVSPMKGRRSSKK